MAKLDLAELANLENEDTAVAVINANARLIEDALENTLSRDGTTPNQMENNLDMNSYRIINLPAPITSTEPIRVADVIDGDVTVYSIPEGGTTRQVLAKLSDVDYNVDWTSLTGDDLLYTAPGTDAVEISYADVIDDFIITPEMYGASPSALGTVVGSLTDCTNAIQAAINRCANIGGGVVQLGPGAYKVTGLTISTNNVTIRGAGRNSTTIVHAPAAASTALSFSAGASLLSDCGVEDLMVGSADTTYLKVALDCVDVSHFHCVRFGVAHYPVDGSMFRGGGGSIGIRTKGRETSVVHDVHVYAEKPLQHSANPNQAAIGLDSWTFSDVLLCAPLSGATTHVVTIDASTPIFNTHWTGANNWIGGVDGLHWSSGGAVASLGYYISGIKCEQGSDNTGGWFVNANPNNLYNFVIQNCTGGDRKFIKSRNIQNLTLQSNLFAPGGGAGTVGLDIDSTVAQTDLVNNVWTSSVTASISGQNNAQFANYLTGRSTAIFASGRYTTATPTETFQSVAVSGLTASAAVATDGSKNLVSVTNTGAGNNVLSAGPTLTGVITAASIAMSGTLNISALTASTALALDGSKNVVSVTNTGTGNNVLSASPTFTGTITAAGLTLSGTVNHSGLTASTALALDGSKNVVSVTNTGSGSNVLATAPSISAPAISGAATFSGTVDYTNNQDGTTEYGVLNNSGGTSAAALYKASNGTNIVRYGMKGTAASAYGALTSGIAYMYGATDFVFMSDGGKIVWASGGNAARMTLSSAGGLYLGSSTAVDPGIGAVLATAHIRSNGATSGIGYATGAGGAVTQATSRTTGVTLNTVSGDITLVSAAGSASYQSFTVTNSAVAATDTISIVQKSGTDKYIILITAVAAGSFQITYATTGGTTSEQPVFHFNVIKGVSA